MYSHLITTPALAAIKPAENYSWFTYTSKKSIDLPYRGIEVPLSRGQKFGVRKSANGKHIRLVMGDEINRVFTIPLDTAKAIAKNCEAIK